MHLFLAVFCGRFRFVQTLQLLIEGLSIFGKQNNVASSLPSDAAPKPVPQIVVRHHHQMALGNSVFFQLLKTSADEFLTDGSPSVFFADGDMIQKPSPSIVSAQNGPNDFALIDANKTAALIPRQKLADFFLRIRTGQADSFRIQP
jgi:hypothetical protein